MGSTVYMYLSHEFSQFFSITVLSHGTVNCEWCLPVLLLFTTFHVNLFVYFLDFQLTTAVYCLPPLPLTTAVGQTRHQRCQKPSQYHPHPSLKTSTYRPLLETHMEGKVTSEHILKRTYGHTPGIRLSAPILYLHTYACILVIGSVIDIRM